MARPETHAGVSAVMAVVMLGFSFLLSFLVNYWNILWIFLFGVFVDADKVFSVNLIRRHVEAYGSMGFAGIKEFWRQQKWIDENHVNFMHTWWALAGVIIFSFLVGSFWPAVSFTTHMLIDGGVLDQNDYPKCSPMPRDILRHFALRYYPKRWLYHTKGMPTLKK